MHQILAVLDHVSGAPNLVVLVPVYLSEEAKSGACVIGSAATRGLPRDKVLVAAIEAVGRSSAQLAKSMIAAPAPLPLIKDDNGGQTKEAGP